MTAYYNENNPFAAQWLRNLIAGGMIAAGDVDDRDIRDIRPYELQRYTQCHFFAGIGVWSRSLRLGGWADDRPAWTGSCPCQPFSAAGRTAGFADERHLWPHWFHLVSECRPSVVFGEQVASKDGWPWLDLVHADMEGADYTFGAGILPAACVGAPHARHRIFFVADAERHGQHGCGNFGTRRGSEPANCRGFGILGDTISAGLEVVGVQHARSEQPAAERTGPTGGFWSDAEWIDLRDETRRPVEPGTFPLAHGVAARVGRTSAYGNAIVAPVVAEFIAAYREARGESVGALAPLTLQEMMA